jgi:transposase
MGRSRAGLTSKIHAVFDTNVLPVRLALTTGRAHDNRLADKFLSRLKSGMMLLADRGYDADWIRAFAANRCAWANIPPRSYRNEPVRFSPHLYRARTGRAPKVRIPRRDRVSGLSTRHGVNRCPSSKAADFMSPRTPHFEAEQLAASLVPCSPASTRERSCVPCDGRPASAQRPERCWPCVKIVVDHVTTVVAGDARCASACAIAWLGGTPRLMSAEARVGFHAAYNSETGQETGVGNALVGAYLNKIGLPYSAVFYITRAAPNSMTWLNIADAEKQGIDVEPLRSGRIIHMPSHGQINQSPETPPAPRNRPLSGAEAVAIERECSDQANARSLHGVERKVFRAECKKRLGL